MQDIRTWFAGGLIGVMLCAGFPASALTPDDAHLEQQWYLDQINAYEAWDTTTGNGEVTVAVLDSGVDLNHPDLEENIWTNPNEIPGDGIDNDGNGYVDDVHGWDFVENDASPIPDSGEAASEEAVSHGTAIAGVIGAHGNNGIGLAGINWDVNLMPVRILNNLGSGRSDNARDAIRYAVNQGADVINLSFVGFDLDERFREVVEEANREGVLVVAAVGNQGEGGLDINEKPIFPACFRADDQSDTVIGVAATTHEDEKASFSNYGSNCTDISAPGDGIYGLAYHDPDWEGFEEPYGGFWSGTSIAVPMIAGASALLLSEYPDLPPQKIKEILQLSVDPVKRNAQLDPGDMGAGRLNIGQAFSFAERMIEREPSTIDEQTGSETAEIGSSIVVTSADRGATPAVRVFSRHGEPLRTFLAYNSEFRGGVRSALGDVDGDGVPEIVTVPGQGGGPHVRVFATNGDLKSQFFADEADRTAGLFVATGDVLSNGRAEIIVGGGADSGGRVTIFSANGDELASFYPYGQRDVEVRVAAGDVDDDGQDEIITSPGAGAEPRVRVFEGIGALTGEFNAYSAGFENGVYVSVGDIDTDGPEKIITGPGSGMEPNVKVFNRSGQIEQEFFAYGPGFLGGVRVTTGHLNGARANIVTVAGPGGGPHVRVFNNAGTVLGGFFADTELVRDGMYVAGF